MLIERPNSLEERWLAIFRELGEPEALLACTYTFTAEFFSDLLERFADAAAESGLGTGHSFKLRPVDVVCDIGRYCGHHVGFNVSFWTNAARLFHPKLFIALFASEVVWSDGSLNLTPAGWHRNREIAMMHRLKRRALPGALRDLLEALPGVAAQQIFKGTVNQPSRRLPGKFLTSLREPVGTQFLEGALKQADEVHLVAPFFERDESNEVPMDDKWLGRLVQTYPNAHFHVYLPMLEEEPLRVQGSREMLAAKERELKHRIVLHPVGSAPGPLHGKLACVVSRGKRTQRAYVLVGSPNMTSAALLVSSVRGNIEAAWILDERWKHVKRLLGTLGSKGRSIDDVEFVEPSLNSINTWMPLRGATYDPIHRILRVEWKDSNVGRRTVLRYADKQIALDTGISVRPFDLVDGIAWLVTHKRGGGEADGCCPIDIPVELLPACRNSEIERTPEQWLKMLGAVSEDGDDSEGRKGRAGRKGDYVPAERFSWSERVRDLAARMRYIEEALCEKTEALTSVEREWLCKLVQQIYAAHEPSAIVGHEQVWRAWVRLEIWYAAENISANALSRRERANWRSRAKRLKKGMGISKLSPIVQKQVRVARRTLGEPP